MRHPLALASLAALLGILPSASEPSAEARCLLAVLAAEGFRAAPHPTDSTRRVLTRTLTGVDQLGIGPSARDSRVEVLEVRLDAGRPGLVVERVSALQPTHGAPSVPEGDVARLDREVRALVRDAAPRCEAR